MPEAVVKPEKVFSSLKRYLLNGRKRDYASFGE